MSTATTGKTVLGESSEHGENMRVEDIDFQMPPDIQSSAVVCKTCEYVERQDLSASCRRRVKYWTTHHSGRGDSTGEGHLGRPASWLDPRQHPCISLASTTDLPSQAVAQPCWDRELLMASSVRAFTGRLVSSRREICME